MKKKKIIFLLITVTILSITATALFYSFYKVDYVKEFNMSLIVGDHIGIGIIAGELNFGMVSPGGGSSTRHIDVYNLRNYPLRVNVHKYGEMKDWISANPSSFILRGKEHKKVIFDANPPPDTKYGNYTGKVRFLFLKT